MLTIVKTTFIMFITFIILNVVTFDMFHIKCLATFILNVIFMSKCIS